MSLTHHDRSEPHPINLHLEFLRRTSVGEALFTVKDVKLGSRISNLHIVLSQKQPHDDKYQDEAEGYIAVSNIATETGLTLNTDYQLYPSPLPVDLQQVSQGHDKNYALRVRDPFAQFRRAAQNIQMFLVRRDQRPKNHPKSINDQWVPNGRWTNDALGFLVDIFPQIVESYVNPYVEEAARGEHSEAELKQFLQSNEPVAKFWYPTLVLNLDVKKLLPEEGVEWLFVRVKAKAIRNGRFDLDIEVLDEHGELIATSVHASLIVDSSRNITRKPKNGKL
ncbi:hypothetical protein LTR10_022195 [Elasticomyces elasticus]|uniref:Dehydrogenase (DH) domain-containing protein n=1 Tax=Exophiala sideris TaxID=1016849 RepID=A0ABR0J4N4_9EURO|nr:hypothetical protein LTR10_022195 [Elasticomyces elasticus]KAK5026841.1 hypothetical protein LTS07_007139 [Exophiala sideris]KAK5033845.1 hypothetical protein LTR13_006444 [Exophiala sideris]KAK5055880.1 hypothetical protein LTR69_008256 [Exophiala sideris]KAK5180787.1 hypothetical protein LTR44_006606 [Eurotiomycetes sp. CCFEE 6388]